MIDDCFYCYYDFEYDYDIFKHSPAPDFVLLGCGTV